MTSKSPQVWPEVVKDMLTRNEEGQEKYNRYLRVDCPDKMLQHLYEELLDAAVYTKTLLLKQQPRHYNEIQREKQAWIDEQKDRVPSFQKRSDIIKTRAQEIEEVFNNLHKNNKGTE